MLKVFRKKVQNFLLLLNFCWDMKRIEREYDLETGLAEVKPIDGEFEGMRVLLAADKFYSNMESYYDIIWMDIQMPVINGWEAVRRIRTSGKKD